MRILYSVGLITILFLVTAVAAIAETRYVSDQLVVTVRSNTTNNYEALDNLPTDTPVEVLSEDAKFIKVKTPKGIVGYVTRQYITKKIPKPIQIATLKKQKDALETRLKELQLDFQGANNLATTSQATLDQLSKELEQTQQQLTDISSKYEDLQERSQNIISMTTERDQLLEENSQINNELQILKEENAAFHRTNMIQWFIAGGGVFFVGWLAGKMSRKKQRYSRF